MEYIIFANTLISANTMKIKYKIRGFDVEFNLDGDGIAQHIR